MFSCCANDTASPGSTEVMPVESVAAAAPAPAAEPAPAPAPAADAGGKSWDITLDRGTEKSGIEIKKHQWKESYVTISNILDGEVMDRFNKANPALATKANDRIVAVNGLSGAD